MLTMSLTISGQGMTASQGCIRTRDADALWQHQSTLRHSGEGRTGMSSYASKSIPVLSSLKSPSTSACKEAGRISTQGFGAQYSKGSYAALHMHRSHDCVRAWSDHGGQFRSTSITCLACGQRLARRDFPRLHLPKRPHAVQGRDCRIDGRHRIRLHPRIHD